MKLPAALQSIMCSLDAFVIVDNHVSIANIFFYKEENGRAFYGIAFSKRILESNFGFNEILTRYDSDLITYPKPKTKWTGLGAEYGNLVPQFRAQLGDRENIKFNLYFTLAHELGHFLDLLSESSLSYDCVTAKSDENNCHRKTYPWRALSWKDFETPSRESGFPENKPICYYDNQCDPATNLTRVEDIQSLYQMLSRSRFISLYSAASADEDFAESVAFMAIKDNFPQASFEVRIGDNFKYDYLGKIDEDIFLTKRNYLRDLLINTSLGHRQSLESKIPLL